ncbi:MAG: RNA 2',3'-cyclic phosphodiesterase [Acidobacteria bacterium]|nr:RNA 2',3'-cyclic phosphodiesterase [Acidobacteriota bacterium]
MPRTFLGWSVPADLREQAGRIAATLRAELPRAAWTRPETYHLTFAFLGDQDDEALARLGSALVSSIRSLPSARSSVGDAGFFPSARRARVGWLGLIDHESVENIAQVIRAVLATEGISFDDKPFHPHLTIVRPKTRWSQGDVERFIEAWKTLRGHPLLVDSVTLFESRQGAGGAIHVPRVVAKCAE